MSWGIWKKLKQGLTKISDFGKKLIGKLPGIIDKGIDVVKKITPILDENGIDTSKIKKGVEVIEKVKNTMPVKEIDLSRYQKAVMKPAVIRREDKKGPRILPIAIRPEDKIGKVNFNGKTWSPILTTDV